MLCYVFLDLFEEQIYSFSLTITYYFQLFEEVIDAFRRIDLDKMPFTFPEQISELPLGLLALLYLGRIGQIVRRLLGIQIYELAEPDVTELIHHALGIIFRHGELVKLH